jgi:hypothetical protein
VDRSRISIAASTLSNGSVARGFDLLDASL